MRRGRWSTISDETCPRPPPRARRPRLGRRGGHRRAQLPGRGAARARQVRERGDRAQLHRRRPGARQGDHHLADPDHARRGVSRLPVRPAGEGLHHRAERRVHEGRAGPRGAGERHPPRRRGRDPYPAARPRGGERARARAPAAGLEGRAADGLSAHQQPGRRRRGRQRRPPGGPPRRPRRALERARDRGRAAPLRARRGDRAAPARRGRRPGPARHGRRAHERARPLRPARRGAAGAPRPGAPRPAAPPRVDVRRRQVFVEAIILEATLEKTRALGVEFQGGAALDGHKGLAQANLGTLAGALADPTSLPGLVLAAASNQKVKLPSGQEVPAHTVLLTALQTDTDVNVLSAPNIITTDNEEAEIVVGRNVPFVASRATSATNLANLFTTVERHDVGITLRMTPQITADDFVRLALFEEVSDIDPTATASVGDPTLVGPTTTIRSASTAVAARDGQTVVIGGLLADTIRANAEAVPFLGHIPVLGHLFRRDDDRRTKTNLLVFLTPHIIATDEQMATNSLRERERMRAALPRPRRDRPPLTGPSWQAPK